MLRVLRCLAFTGLALTLGSCTGGNTSVGAVLPLTGAARIYGESIRRGIDLAIEQSLAEPGHKKKIELTVVDSGSDPTKAKDQLQILYDDGAVAAIGGVTSAEALEMVGVAKERQRALISPSASNPGLTGIAPSFFRVFPSDVQEGGKMAQFAWETLQAKSVALVVESGPYASGIAEVFSREFERPGGKIIGRINVLGGTDRSAVAEQALGMAPDAVYVAGFAKTTADVVRNLRSLGYNGQVLTTSAFATPGALAEAGDAANGVLFTQTTFDIDDPAENVKAFVAAYQTRYGVAPDLYAAHGYDAARVLITALDAAGSADADALIKSLRSVSAYPGVTGTLQFDDKGDVQKPPAIYAILDGHVESYESGSEEKRAAIQQRLAELRAQRESQAPVNTL